MKLDQTIIQFLACPRCKSKLQGLTCVACAREYPQVDGIPILVNEAHSLFKLADFTQCRGTTYRRSSKLKKAFKRFIPSITLNVKSKANVRAFFLHLVEETPQPRVLVIGGAVAGEGWDEVPSQVILVETDVAFGPRTALICDAHDLPFQDETFNGVVAQAVLEHVLEPGRCVSEIHRVLKKGGAVYAETPFMQQVHAGRYDFTRFTHLGHLYLFRHFAEILSGPACGPGMALAWSYCYFLQSFFRHKTLGQLAFAFGSLTAFWLKYLDYFLLNRPNSYDAASSYFFLGRKSNVELSGEELLKCYQGMIY